MVRPQVPPPGPQRPNRPPQGPPQNQTRTGYTPPNQPQARVSNQAPTQPAPRVNGTAPAAQQRTNGQYAPNKNYAPDPREQNSTPRPGSILPGWSILPLRLFLGFSFLMAGWDKLSDPNYLNPASRDYIGQQITRFAAGTPLQGFLMNVAVPNAGLFGVVVMGGELCIGIAVLLGLLTRFSAIMGLLLNLTFFLSATWDVRPFYFGADLPYVFGWLTLALAGPGPFALDWVLAKWIAGQPTVMVNRAGQRVMVPDESVVTRRAFVTGGAAVLAGAALAATGIAWGIAHPNSGTSAGGTGSGLSGTGTLPAPGAAGGAAATPTAQAAVPPPATDTPAAPPAAGSNNAAPTQPPPQPTDTAAPAAGSASQGTLIAQAGQLPQGQAGEFQLANGDPAVLVHNDKGYVAYVAICTHRGCQVQPMQNGLIGCPCHGAEFDANQGGAVVRGPANAPLSPVAITVDQKGNVYLANQ